MSSQEKKKDIKLFNCGSLKVTDNQIFFINPGLCVRKTHKPVKDVKPVVETARGKTYVIEKLLHKYITTNLKNSILVAQDITKLVKELQDLLLMDEEKRTVMDYENLLSRRLPLDLKLAANSSQFRNGCDNEVEVNDSKEQVSCDQKEVTVKDSVEVIVQYILFWIWQHVREEKKQNCLLLSGQTLKQRWQRKKSKLTLHPCLSLLGKCMQIKTVPSCTKR
ncbi:uncharacterized protein LOC111635564 [Centruroides sculpturatus]|uniref:uncharacterized protein LOC111635564 n=1 Tax=Centruroides sculpturatus TaxID=218467 RepID=UPI000C6D644B|nr:uncharacterized protein LOC111635564 [Centruroides sculpturatus]